MVPIDYYDSVASRYAGRTAVIQGDHTLTYRELTAMSHAIARYIGSVARRDGPTPVAILSPNDFRILPVMLGVMRAGGVIVPVHAGNSMDVTLHHLQAVQPELLFFHSSLAERAATLRREVPSVAAFVTLDDCDAGDAALSAIVRDPSPFVARWIEPNGNSSRPVYYWATSGSTGMPKVVIDDCQTFDSALKTVRPLHRSSAERHTSLVLTPMSHGSGPRAFGLLTLGATMVVMPSFDVRKVFETIEERHITDVWLSPTALYLLLASPHLHGRDLSSVRQIVLGTAAVAPSKLREAVAAFGPVLMQTYGQIETGHVTALTPPMMMQSLARQDDRLMSSGTMLFNSRCAIMGDDGELLPPGVQGEIVVRGMSVKRYLDPAVTADARRFGWHHTGDLGYMDDEGYLYIVGRLRDVINMAGFKIAAQELERCIAEVAGVVECAVVAAPDDVRGEVPVAIVVVNEAGAVTQDQAIDHCRRRLGNRNAPAIVHIRKDLPRTPAGKIDKLALRREFWRRDTRVTA